MQRQAVGKQQLGLLVQTSPSARKAAAGVSQRRLLLQLKARGRLRFKQGACVAVSPLQAPSAFFAAPGRILRSVRIESNPLLVRAAIDHTPPQI
jgi:hypothetical protein